MNNDSDNPSKLKYIGLDDPNGKFPVDRRLPINGTQLVSHPDLLQIIKHIDSWIEKSTDEDRQELRILMGFLSSRYGTADSNGVYNIGRDALFSWEEQIRSTFHS